MKLISRLGSLLFVSILSLGSAQAATLTYTASLSGANAAPANGSTGTGMALVTFDLATHMLGVTLSFAGLSGNTTAAHIHAPTAVAGSGVIGVATTTPFFAGFPVGVTSGTFSAMFDTTLVATYNLPFLTAYGGTAAGAEVALAAALADGKAYLNIHTDVYPSGEIRGFLTAPSPVPLPAGVPLVVTGFGALLWAGRRKRNA